MEKKDNEIFDIKQKMEEEDGDLINIKKKLNIAKQSI